MTIKESYKRPGKIVASIPVEHPVAKGKHRILVMSHAHPDFSLGGGELAAYNLYKAYGAHDEVEQAWFLARADGGNGPTGHISQRRENEYLWDQAVHDWHLIKAAHQDSVCTWFADLIRGLRPSVVHTHHYAHFGLEYLRVIKQVDPSIHVVMTLHEYMAICANHGQMIKVGGKALCSEATPVDCHKCFPEKSVEDFWLREHFIKGHLDLVDQFVSPSEFLRQRYIRWGLPASKIVVIENGQPTEPILPPRKLPEGGTRNRFGYFGQINPFKGLPVLLEALHGMSKTERSQVVLEVHGANLEQQTSELQQKVHALADPLIKKGVVQWMGTYRPDELRQRMAYVDWVVMPSIWWENSPMVIQEAFACGRPVICSDIGGMAEKVRHNIDGLHVATGNVYQWTEILKTTADYTLAWDHLLNGISKPISVFECASLHLNAIDFFVKTA